MRFKAKERNLAGRMACMFFHKYGLSLSGNRYEELRDSTNEEGDHDSN